MNLKFLRNAFLGVVVAFFSACRVEEISETIDLQCGSGRFKVGACKAHVEASVDLVYEHVINDQGLEAVEPSKIGLSDVIIKFEIPTSILLADEVIAGMTEDERQSNLVPIPPRKTYISSVFREKSKEIEKAEYTCKLDSGYHSLNQTVTRNGKVFNLYTGLCEHSHYFGILLELESFASNDQKNLMMSASFIRYITNRIVSSPELPGHIVMALAKDISIPIE